MVVEGVVVGSQERQEQRAVLGDLDFLMAMRTERRRLGPVLKIEKGQIEGKNLKRKANIVKKVKGEMRRDETSDFLKTRVKR